MDFDQVALELRSEMGANGSPIGIIGSSSFHHPESESTCDEIGRILAETPYTLLTGGVGGAPAGVAKSFHRHCQRNGFEARCFMYCQKTPAH